MDDDRFEYQSLCTISGCQEPAVYKVAATWSDGNSYELKNYGTACEAHRGALLDLARSKRAGLTLAEGEKVGPVGLYKLVPGQRDVDLPRLPD